MRTWRRRFLGVVLYLIGVSLVFWPAAATYHLERKTQNYIESFEKEYGEKIMPEEKRKTEDPLYAVCVQYNKTLYEQKQRYFTDPQSCVQIPGELDALTGDAMGYIEISAMEIVLPLYLGASQQHMSEGAVILGQTSLPVGGENTNCVIAGHRGYRGAPYFRDIEKLRPGDEVLIHNPWETLCYLVEEAEIIDPCDSDKVKIRAGCDRVTLLTCHPYRSGGAYRYVVYCSRKNCPTKKKQETAKEQEEVQNVQEAAEEKEDIQNVQETVCVSSEPDIRREQCVRIAAVAFLLVLPVVLMMQKANDRRRKGDKHKGREI